MPAGRLAFANKMGLQWMLDQAQAESGSQDSWLDSRRLIVALRRAATDLGRTARIVEDVAMVVDGCIICMALSIRSGWLVSLADGPC